MSKTKLPIVKKIISEAVKKVLSEIEWKPIKHDEYRNGPNEYFGEYEGDVPQDWISTSNLWKRGNKGYLEKPQYDKRGFNTSSKKHKITGTNRDEEGFNILGFDKDGYDREGYGLSGYDREGFNKKGYDREGYNREGFNKKGYDREGYNKSGFHPSTGLNRDGFDRRGQKRGKKSWDDVIYEWVLDNEELIINSDVTILDKTNSYLDYMYSEFKKSIGNRSIYWYGTRGTWQVSKNCLKILLEDVAPNIKFNTDSGFIKKLIDTMLAAIYECIIQEYDDYWTSDYFDRDYDEE